MLISLALQFYRFIMSLNIGMSWSYCNVNALYLADFGADFDLVMATTRGHFSIVDQVTDKIGLRVTWDKTVFIRQGASLSFSIGEVDWRAQLIFEESWGGRNEYTLRTRKPSG